MQALKKVLFLLLLPFLIFSQTEMNEIQTLIHEGRFAEARILIGKILETENDAEKIYELNFQLDLMKRIEIDFNKKEEVVLKYIKKYFPEANAENLRQWEAGGKLECKIIDGERRYFRNAAPNLFRVDEACKRRKEEVDGLSKSNLENFLEKELPEVAQLSISQRERFIKRGTIKINYTVTVPANAVPAGEIVRCWLPFPKENSSRQKNIKLISSFPQRRTIAPDSFLQRTIYFEQKTAKDAETRFNIELSYDAYAEYFHQLFDCELTIDSTSSLYNEFTKEKIPHILFSPELKKLSMKIVNDAKTPKEKFRKIFEYISEEIPWASALEYSTIPSISNYCVEKGYGDCGIKSLLFITLCRYNGIPAKWQSGWMFQPGSVNLHDWAQVYFDQTGWITVDADYGLQPADNENVEWYFAKGVDAFHFIVNDDFGRDLFPSKIFPRSETVDFQRGEVEWKGGNLYFDKWDYEMKVEYIFDNQ